MPSPKKSKALGRLPKPRVIDPITGEDIQYTQAGEFWIAFTSLWTSKPFPFKAYAEYAVSHVLGQPPSYPKPGAQVIRDVNEPPRRGDEE